ncbi:MAG: hypothetical protein RLY31_271 [Bacteroidota bacterium]|jgi:alpha-L-fucosidase
MNVKSCNILLAAFLLLTAACSDNRIQSQPETAAEKDARMNWWREARFGMFIHWGLYAVPAGEWAGVTNYGEWIRNNAKIPLDVYDQFREQFNPTSFDADEWVRIAKDAGMQYIVITTKHHDGFCLFDSGETAFDVRSTPFGRDIIAELAAACAAQGIRLGFYHSIMDWHHPDYLPRRTWETDRPTEGADFDRYVQYMKNQLGELCRNYGEAPAILWFDGEWESTWTADRGMDLYRYVRSLKPDILVNNRVGNAREGMAGLTREGEFGGDFGTPEQEVPASGIPGVDWESCMTMNENWGYNRVDKNFKSVNTLLRHLVDITSKGGNFLLNVGPTAEGLIPAESVERLAAIGRWTRANGEAVYGTTPAPFDHFTWGSITQRRTEQGVRLYLHVFDRPQSGTIRLNGIRNDAAAVFFLADAERAQPEWFREEDAVVVRLPESLPDSHVSVVCLDLLGAPDYYLPPVVRAPRHGFVSECQVTMEVPASPDIHIRYTLDGTVPHAGSDRYTGPLILRNTSLIRARAFRAEDPVSGTTDQSVARLEPQPASGEHALAPGWTYRYFEGMWNTLPDTDKLQAARTGTVKGTERPALPADGEGYAYEYQGFVEVPETEVYTFHLRSDDGSRLWVDQALLVDNDGAHGARTVSGSVALAAGKHAIRLLYFQATGGSELDLSWESARIAKVAIPENAWFHVPVK